MICRQAVIQVATSYSYTVYVANYIYIASQFLRIFYSSPARTITWLSYEAKTQLHTEMYSYVHS